MTINFKSYYYPLANTSINWLPMDTKELYLYNLKNNFEKLQEYGWIGKEVTYTFNSHGFRTKEFIHEPNVLFLGCSLTVGIGINAQDRWTELLAEKLGLACYNLGIGGASLDTAYRLGIGWIDKLNPSIVILRTPPGIRFELVYENEICNLNVNVKHHEQYINDYMLYYAKEDTNHEINALKNIMALKYFCENRNLKLYIDQDINYLGSKEYARDLAHPGIQDNIDYAQKILQQI